MVTELTLGAHEPLVIVQAKVYVTPGVPVKPLVALLISATAPPTPAVILHWPVPTAGTFAFNDVKLPQTI